MNITSFREIDLLYALFLGRLPENNFVRQDNLDRPVLELAKAMIVSDEFRQAIVENLLSYGRLPHKNLPSRLLPDALAFATSAGLMPLEEGTVAADWRTALARVLSGAACRSALVEIYGPAPTVELIDRLGATEQTNERALGAMPLVPRLISSPDIATGVEIIAHTICRGWLVDRNNPDAPMHILIRVNGHPAKIILADEFRRDVQETYGGTGRNGFTVRFESLPGTKYLSRATVEISEVSQGVKLLVDYVVELTLAPEVSLDADLREKVQQLGKAITNIQTLFTESEQNRAKHLHSTPPPDQISVTEVAEIQTSLNEIELALKFVAGDLPNYSRRQSWSLSAYHIVRSSLELIPDPPSNENHESVSVLIMENPEHHLAHSSPALESVISQTLKAHEIFVITSDNAGPALPLPAAAIEIVCLQDGEVAAAAANRVATRMTGTHLFIIDSAVALAPQALAWIAVALGSAKTSIVYTDGEVTVQTDDGLEQYVPVFRSAFDYDLLLQRNEIGNSFCIRREAFTALGGFTLDARLDPCHDLLLRAATKLGKASFAHLPVILQSEQALDPSEPTIQVRLNRTVKTVQEHLGSKASVVAHDDPVGRAVVDAAQVRWRSTASECISVIIPTLDRADLAFALVSSLKRHTTAWDRIEIIIMVNGKLEPDVQSAFGELAQTFGCVKVVHKPMRFNWGAINNAGVWEHANGDILVFMNDDMICLTRGWDEHLRGQLARAGVIGGRLLYANGAIQHVGIAFCGDGITAHEAMGDTADNGLYRDRTLLVHRVGAVTGAFLACRRALFDQLQGFDTERYAITSSDADFCVRARNKGLRVIYDPFLTWIHHESVSRGNDSQDHRKHLRAAAEQERWRARFAASDLVDLSLNPHLTHSARPFETFHRTTRADAQLWLMAQGNRGSLPKG